MHRRSREYTDSYSSFDDEGVFAYVMKEWKSWICCFRLLLLLEDLLIYYMSVVKDILKTNWKSWICWFRLLLLLQDFFYLFCGRRFDSVNPRVCIWINLCLLRLEWFTRWKCSTWYTWECQLCVNCFHVCNMRQWKCRIVFGGSTKGRKQETEGSKSILSHVWCFWFDTMFQ